MSDSKLRHFSYIYYWNFINMSNKFVFPDSLKQANIKPVYKRDSRDEKENYRPVSVLPNYLKFMSVVCIRKWLGTSTLFFLNTNKGYRAKQCLLTMIEKWRASWRSLPYIKFHVIRKTQNINENIYRISIQLLSLDMDASF